MNLLFQEKTIKNQFLQALNIDEYKSMGVISKLLKDCIKTIKYIDVELDETMKRFNELNSPQTTSLITFLALHDLTTVKHSLNVMLYCMQFSKFYNFSKEEFNNFSLAGLLHDIGKLHIDDYILQTNRTINTKERLKINTHTQHGFVILKEHSYNEAILDCALNHHERIDGSGYTTGTRKISKFAQILSVIDVFEALTNERQYKEALPVATALGVLAETVKKNILSKKILNDMLPTLNINI